MADKSRVLQGKVTPKIDAKMVELINMDRQDGQDEILNYRIFT
jgi:hypothetical protein